MREPPGPCGAGRLRCVWLCGAWPLCVPAGGGPPRGLLPRQISGRRVACFVGPGRCVCRWAAARPRDRHTRACGSEWSISKPGQAPPPPTGTAARPRRRPPAPRPGPASLRGSRGGLLSVGLVVRELPALALRALLRPPHRRLRCCVWWRVVSVPCRPHGSFPSVGDYRCERPGPATAHQFRMQFPSVIVSVCVSLQCCVTRVFELHATFA